MKIQNIHSPQQSDETGTGIRTPAGDFQKILEARLGRTSVVTQSTAAAGVTDAASVPASVRLEGLELTETALELLEQFQGALADRNVAAASLEPFASALEEQTSGLLAVREQLPADHPLAGVLERVAAVTYLESAKFRRGDYHG